MLEFVSVCVCERERGVFAVCYGAMMVVVWRMMGAMVGCEIVNEASNGTTR